MSLLQPGLLTSTNHRNGCHLFDEAPDQHTRRRDAPVDALDALRSMASGHTSSSALLPVDAALRRCAALAAARSGRELHAFLLRRNVDCAATGTSLVGFYGKCGHLAAARHVFDRMSDKDVVSWTVMLMSYSGSQAMALLADMLRSGGGGVTPNRHTLTVVLRRTERQSHGAQLHAYVIKHGWDSDTFVGCSLVDMYARHGALANSLLSFDRIAHKDLVCYNSLLSWYGRTGSISALVRMFVEMVMVAFEPNQSTVIALLNGCANSGFLVPSKQFHAQVILRGFAPDERVQGVIVDMYAKCGDLEAARRAFYRISDTKNVVIWNSIIGGYGKHGLAREALETFRRMEAATVRPDHITFVCLLSACSHAGLVDEGWGLFGAMRDVYGICARGEHYCCVVDLLGRTGMVREAYEFILSSKCEHTPSVWGALLSACRAQGDAEIGEIAARRLFELEPDCSSSYVAMASIHAASGRWGDADAVREQMDERTIRKEVGCSWIEIDGVVHKFRAGEQSPPSPSFL